MYQDDDFKDEEEESQSSGGFVDTILNFYNANKKLIWILGGMIIFILVVSMFLGGGSSQAPITPPKVVVSQEKLALTINYSMPLSAAVNGEPKNFTWTSSDPTIATVDNSGLVKGIDYGTATITATYIHSDGNSYTATCEVVVGKGDPNLQLTNVQFPEGEVMITQGDKYELPIVVSPSDGYITNLEFTSYNKEIVTVDEQGIIKALKIGKGIIKLSVNNGTYTDEISVNVVGKLISPQVSINPINIDFADKLLKIETGETIELDYNYEPYNATIANLTWKSSNEEVATVSNGNVIGIKPGTAEITLSALNGVSDVMTIEVTAKNIPVENIEILSAKTLNLYVGNTSTILSNIIPSDATNKKIIYSTSNPSVATVSEDGKITAQGVGSTTIKLTTEDGNKSQTIVVTVSKQSSGSSGSTSKVGSIKFRDANGSELANSVNAVLGMNHKGPVSVNIASGNVSKLTYCVEKCSSKSQCENPTCNTTNELAMGKTINFNDGNGIYVIKSIKHNGSYSATVNLKYVNIGGIDSLNGASSGNNSELTPLNASWEFNERYYTFEHGYVNEGFVKLTASKKITDIYYCYQYNNNSCATVQELRGESPFSIIIPLPYIDPTYCNGGYIGLENSTHYYRNISPTSNATLHFCAHEEHSIVLTVKYADGTWGRATVKTKQS